MSPSEFSETVSGGDLKAIRQALRADQSLANVDIVDGQRPLHEAPSKGVALCLIKAGADVNVVGRAGMTPLHWMIDYTETEIIQVLIEHGAKLDILDDRGLSPLACAARKWPMLDGCEEEASVFQMLKEAGAPYDLPAACMMADAGRVRELIAQDPSVVKGISAKTANFILAPLMIHQWGTLEGKKEIFDLLFAHGFRPDAERSMRYYGDDTYPAAEHLRELLQRL